MSGVRMEFGLEDAEVRQVLTSLSTVTSDLRRPLRAIGEEARAVSMEAFEDETSPAGDPWEPSERAIAEGGQTLSDRGVLKGSLDLQAFPRKVALGSTLVYAAIQHFGGEAGRGHAVTLPERPYLPEPGQLDQGFLFDVLSRHFERVFR